MLIDICRHSSNQAVFNKLAKWNIVDLILKFNSIWGFGGDNLGTGALLKKWLTSGIYTEHHLVYALQAIFKIAIVGGPEYSL